MENLFQENGIPIAATEAELKPRATIVEYTFLLQKEGDENSRVLYQFVDENGTVLLMIGHTDNQALQTAPRVKAAIWVRFLLLEILEMIRSMEINIKNKYKW